MQQRAYSSWLHGFALMTAAFTLLLLCAGGLVTSHGVGMAVPDWPNTYGYNMFLFPFSQWVGGIFYEHTHRLVAAFVGLLTAIMAIWLWARETEGRHRWLGIGAIVFVLGLMGVRNMYVYLALATLAPVVIGVAVRKGRRDRGTLRWLGVAALAAVILQGVLGGLRVVWLKDGIGIFHATLAQLFFVLTCVLGLFTSKAWLQRRFPARREGAAVPQTGETGAPLRWLVVGTTVLILAQLILGATMRHQHAGLAIPDFPLAYGKLWPAMDAASVEQYNQQRVEVTSVHPITATHIALQMAHRVAAVAILAGVAACAWLALRRLNWRNPLARLGLAWLALILVQVALGAWTVLSKKAADIATAHVLVGALSLATGALMSIFSFRNPESVPDAFALSQAGRAESGSVMNAKTAAAQA